MKKIILFITALPLVCVLVACNSGSTLENMPDIESSDIHLVQDGERIDVETPSLPDTTATPESPVSQALPYNPANYRRTGSKPEELPATIAYEETKDVPREIYDFVINYMQTREISEAEASQFVKFFGDYGDFMMEISKESISWAGEWSIDRFEKIDDNLFVFFQHYIQGYDPDEIYTGPPRPSFYMPFFVYIVEEEMYIVQGFEWLPQEWRDRLDPEDYLVYIWDMNPDDVVSVEDVVAFQDLLG